MSSALGLDKVLESLLTGAGGDLDALSKAIESGKSDFGDKDKFWQCKLDKKDFGYALIRFLPSIDPTILPFAEYYRHSFKGPGGMWFIDQCPTTIKQECPVCDMNKEKWSEGENSPGRIFVSGFGSGENRTPGSKRNMSWKVNALILSHTGNPADDGKVFPMSLGPALIKELKRVMDKDYARKLNPFSLTADGANFVLEINPGTKGLDFSKSRFETQSALWADLPDRMDRLKKLFTPYNQETGEGFMNLSKFTDPTKFNSFEKMKERLDKVMKRTETGTAGTKIAQPSSPPPAAGPAKEAEKPPFEPTPDEDPFVAEYKNLLAKA